MLITPSSELPPTVPLTAQFTAVFVVPVTVAVNCCCWPRQSFAVEGETLTLTVGVGDGVGEGEPEGEPPAAPQPTSVTAAKGNKSTAPHVRRSLIPCSLPALIARRPKRLFKAPRIAGCNAAAFAHTGLPGRLGVPRHMLYSG